MSDTVLVSRENGLATLTLNRPERMNSLTTELMIALRDRLREVATDPEIRAVLLTGSGDRAFSAGADLDPPKDSTSGDVMGGAVTLEQSIDQLQSFQESSHLLHTMPKPTVAAINGAAAGASLSMTMACDFRLAAEHAVFTTAFARIGFSGDFGGSYFMTKLLGTAKARELYMLGDRVDAEEALRIGLVTRVFSSDTFRKETAAFVQRLVEGPPLSYRYMKRNLNLALTASLPDIMDLEAEAMMRTARSEDFVKAVGAFLNKKKPSFEGR